MSDGPHRSLPMPRRWRDVAERAAKAVFSADDVCEAITHALRKDAKGLPVESVREVLGVGRQGYLFAEDRLGEIEALRTGCRGSALGNTFIDCAIEAAGNGLYGDAACRTALANALEQYTRDCFRGVEEHYLREASARSAGFVRDRLDATRDGFAFGTLASDLASPGIRQKPASRLPRHTGIDEGPPL
ncbi:MAG: hypothetical protein AB7I79_15550 [Rhizobiaceae bacterium]